MLHALWLMLHAYWLMLHAFWLLLHAETALTWLLMHGSGPQWTASGLCCTLLQVMAVGCELYALGNIPE